MSQIDNIVEVQISRQTTQIDIEAFDIPLILVNMTPQDEINFPDRIRTYTGIEGVMEDLGVHHKAYTMAAQLLGGDIKPSTFKVGKRLPNEDYSEALAACQNVDDTWYVILADDHTDSVIMDIAKWVQAQRKLYFFSTSSQLALQQSQSVTYTATVDFGSVAGAADDDTLSVVIAGERYVATYSSSDFGSFTYAGAGSGTFAGSFSLSGAELTITNSTVNFVVTSARKVFNDVTTDIDPSAISVTDPVGMDIGQRLHAMSMDRSIPLFSNTADAEFPECSWVGTQIVEVPGSNTWEYKKLVGVTVSVLTDSQITLLENRGYNYYIPVKGANITRRGKVAEGEWVD